MGFQALSPVPMRCSIFCDKTLCSPGKVNRRFRVTVPRKRRLEFTGLHGVISQKTELFKC
jgi:hypothetical protein